MWPCNTDSGRRLTPAPVQPEPLFGELPNPSFNNGSHGLHGALDVDAATRIARRLDGRGNLAPKAVAVGLTHDAHAVDRQFRLPRQNCDQRLCQTWPAEECNLDALAVMLIGKHPDMHAGLQKTRQFDRRVEAGRNEFAHEWRAQLDDDVTDRVDVRPAEEDG